MPNYFQISQIPNELIEKDLASTWLEAELGGQPFKLRLNTLLGFLLQNPPNTFVQAPGYTVDEVAETIAIDGTGRALIDGTEKSLPAATLSYEPVNTAGYSRFDAIVYNTVNNQYDLITGTAASDPTTPVYDFERNLLLLYLQINNDTTTGTTVPPNPQHERNKDTYLDLGGSNEVSAAAITAALSKLGYFAGYFPLEADLTSQTANSFALVGNPLGLYVYDQATDTWSLPASSGDGGSGGSGGSTTQTISVPQAYVLAFNTDLDTPNENRLFFKGSVDNIEWITDTDITGTSFYPQIAGTAEGSAITTAAALQTWVDDNIISENTLWYVRIIITPDAAATDEIVARFTHSKSYDITFTSGGGGDPGTGWAQYKDTQYTEASPFTVSAGVWTTVPNNAGSKIESELPPGVTAWYDPATQLLTPHQSGDGNTYSVDLSIRPTVSDSEFYLAIDIGGTQGRIVSKKVVLGESGQFDDITIDFPGRYSLATFLANGGKVQCFSEYECALANPNYVSSRYHKSLTA